MRNFVLDDAYPLPNIARRLVETFLTFRYPSIAAGELLQKFERVDFDEGKKVRILRFLHVFSHAKPIGGSEHNLALLSEAKQVLAEVLELIKAEDEKHYGEMLVCLGQPAASGIRPE